MLRIWLKAHCPPGITTLIAAPAIVAVLFASVVLPMPRIGVLAGLLIPLPVMGAALSASGIIAAINGGNRDRERLPRSWVATSAHTAFVAVTTIVIAGLLVGFYHQFGVDALLQGARNLIAMIGLGLLCRRMFSPNVSPIMPVVFSFLACMTRLRILAWPVSPGTDMRSWGIALGVYTIGFLGLAAGWLRYPAVSAYTVDE